MDSQIIFVYCLCDDVLKALEHREDPQCRVSDAEILTTALVAALYFGGHFRRAQEFLHEQGYLPRQLSSSRFVRRVHRCVDLLLPLFHGLAKLGQQLNAERIYVIDFMSSTVFRSRCAITFEFDAAGAIKVKSGEGIKRASAVTSMA